jgi:hypothetical protein
VIGFANLHVATVKHGEVYVHHFWLLVAIFVFALWCTARATQ